LACSAARSALPYFEIMTNEPPLDPALDERVQIHHADGSTEYVQRDLLVGLDDWIANWAQNPQLPSAVTFTGWQGVDDEHPVGTGTEGYRIVYKTIRTVVVPEVSWNAGRVMVRLLNSPMTWGEARYPNAVRYRRDNEWMVPQWGDVERRGDQFRYAPNMDPTVAMEAHEETTPSGNFVEILYQLPDAGDLDYKQKLAMGQARVAPLTAAMDLIWGERVIGAVIAEEVGEVFGDWHWNRIIGGPTVLWEGQARLGVHDGRQYVEGLTLFNTIFGEHSEDERARLRVAAQWYWRADSDSDRVMRFLSYWLCSEACTLEGGEWNIRALKKAVAAILDTSVPTISAAVGRIYSLRGLVAHGKGRAVDDQTLRAAKAIAEALLSRRLVGRVTPDRVEALRISLSESVGTPTASGGGTGESWLKQ